MEKLQFLIIHCTATPEKMPVSPRLIEKWHLEERGWSQVGYRRLIMRDGKIYDWTNDNGDQWVQSNEITNGAFGYNRISQHWALAGGFDAKPRDIFTKHFTDEQFHVLNRKIKEFINIHPDIKIIGHNQVSEKACPGFWVPSFLKLIQVPEKNIINAKLV
jgi:hypothetical protein